ncbi:MAG TPA: SDR family oxidoreductase [Stenomitos sp.]
MTRAGDGVFVTGTTGFVGKVVLSELIRRREELGIGTLYVLIRPKRGRTPEERFHQDIVGSDCFRQLPPDWPSMCHPVAGDLTAEGLALSDADRRLLQANVRRVIHCAASVEFDSPLPEAAASNVTGALNVLEFAKGCTALEAMVDVSTAYISPHAGGTRSFTEELAPLPVDPAETYRSILDGTAHEASLLAKTGHANTYTLTKCLAEHLLVARHGSVPLTIVRPSIISACRRFPFAGWIDSKAAFAGFVALYGMGYLRVLGVNPDVRLDIVPCDEVADRVITAAFRPGAASEVRIRYAVAGLKRTLTIREICDVNVPFFERYPAGRRAGFAYVGPMSPRLHVLEFLHHRLPLWLALAAATVTGRTKQTRAIRRLLRGLLYLNRGFRYFTHRTFDFVAAEPPHDPSFDATSYFETVARGIHQHLLHQGEHQVALAGKDFRDGRGDLAWALGQPDGNAVHRLLGYLLRKAFRRGSDLVSVDKASFEAAMADARPDELVVVVPTHRSYADFLLCPYLFFAWPDLRLPMPHIAATEDFARIPFLGTLLRWAQAFYIKRGLGREDPELTRRVSELATHRQALTFFIEGRRSRSRRFLAPRRGLLRALQSTQQPCRLLPVAISYDRIPEEAAFRRELRGGADSTHRLGPVLEWLGHLWKGHVRLGRVHVACGRPLHLTPDSDVHALSREVLGELQAATVATHYHLRAFLAGHPQSGVNLAGLIRLIEARGGKVLQSRMPFEGVSDPLIERCLHQQWLHVFNPDLRRLWPEHPALRDHLERNAYRTAPEPAVPAPVTLLRALFEPVCRDYQAVARHLAARLGGNLAVTVPELLATLPATFRPEVEAVLDDLLQRQVLSVEAGVYGWGPEAEAIAAYAAACDWPEGSPEPAPARGSAELSPVR